MERPCHDAVPSAERLGPCLPPGPSLEAQALSGFPSQAKPPIHLCPPDGGRKSPAKQRLRVKLGARAFPNIYSFDKYLLSPYCVLVSLGAGDIGISGDCPVLEWRPESGGKVCYSTPRSQGSKGAQGASLAVL